MSAQPTPGPLVVRVGANGDVGIISTSQKAAGEDIGGSLVAECFAEIRRAGEGARAEALANARLFATSHDLLEALTQCRAVLHTALAETGTDDEPKRSVLIRRIDVADAAIAKATGEAPC